jgi:hypothetical protein
MPHVVTRFQCGRERGDRATFGVGLPIGCGRNEERTEGNECACSQELEGIALGRGIRFYGKMLSRFGVEAIGR